jgi:hypothetical protein
MSTTYTLEHVVVYCVTVETSQNKCTRHPPKIGVWDYNSVIKIRRAIHLVGIVFSLPFDVYP